MANEKRYHVGAGSYYVDHQTPVLLEAYLGTCIGVALYDEEAKVGGLSHLLLPEPVSPTNTFQPEKYASSGLPLFLESLYTAGAENKRLKATIAGGALVSPVESRDLQLNIGGRTEETVMNYLNKEGIQIVKSETGGFLTCCLSLNLQDWQCRIDPTGISKLSSEHEIHVPTPEEVSQAMNGLQPIPQVALKILRLIDDEEYAIAQLTEEIRKDQVISARTLKLCNSVMYSGRNKIETLDHALVFLGMKLLVKLVISASVENLFTHSGAGYSLCKGGLYHHAIGTAIIAEKLANLTGKAKPGLAYTAGLLHDIGKVVLDQHIASAYPLFYRQMFEEGNNFAEAEKRILGVDHTEVGSELAQKWSFPESLIETIRYHHRPQNSGQYHDLVHLVYLADLLMSQFHAGLELERLETDTLAARLDAIGLSVERFPDIVDLIPIQVFESAPEQALMQQ